MLSVGRDSRLRLSLNDGSPVINQWASLRRDIYDILVFDPSTVAAQAVLSHAIGVAIDDGVLTSDDWSLTDEQLLDLLRQHDRTKDSIAREYLGRLPAMAFCVQLAGDMAALGLESRSQCKARVEAVLADVFRKEASLAYIFIDKGTFEKRLAFIDPDSGAPWFSGDSSRSVILYGFVRTSKGLRRDQCREAVGALLSNPRLACQVKRILVPPFGTDDSQPTLDSAAS
jgi:hypothetical protein